MRTIYLCLLAPIIKCDTSLITSTWGIRTSDNGIHNTRPPAVFTTRHYQALPLFSKAKWPPPSKTHFSNPIKQHTMSNNPLFSISLNILNQLKHLKISEPINISKSKFIAGGGFSDVFKTNHVFPDSPTKRAIAIKRLRFYMKEDIVMVRTKVIPSHILI